MAKYKLLEIHEDVKLRGWVLLPIDASTRSWELTHMLDVDENYDDSDAEIWDEHIVEIPDHEMKYMTRQPVDYDDVHKYIIEDEDN